MDAREYTTKKRVLNFYKEKAEAWKDANDDRRIFSNTYYMMVEALEAMKEVDNLYVKRAFAKEFAIDLATLNEIENRFKHR